MVRVRLLCPLRGSFRVDGSPRPVAHLPAGAEIDVTEDDAVRYERRRQAVRVAPPKKKKASKPQEG